MPVLDPQDNNTKVHVHLIEVQFAGTASTDLTTNIVRRLAELTGEMTARLKAIILAAGGAP